MKIKHLFIYCSIILSSSCLGKSTTNDKEKIKDLFKKVANFYEANNSFQVDLSYALYPTAKSNQIIEKYDGYVAKKDKGTYAKIGKTEFVFDAKYTLKIDNESKLMQLNYEKLNDNNNLFYDIKKYLTNFSNYILTDNKNEWVCTMTTPKVTFIPYTKIVIIIDKKTNSITKELLYLIVKNKYENPNGKLKQDYPRIEISIKNFTPKIKNDNIFKLDHYINSKQGKNYPIGDYKSYKIVK